MNKAEAKITSVGPDWVMMVHPDLEDSYSLQPIAAFEEVYRDKGWEVASLDDATGGKPEAKTANPQTPIKE